MPAGDEIRILTWNLFHGQDGSRLGPTPASTLFRRGVDDGERLHLNRKWTREMGEVIAARNPTVAALQEVPPQAVSALAEVTGMRAARSLMPPLIGPTALRGRLAERNPDLWRTHEGTANVVLVGPGWEIVPGGVWTVRHNPRSVVCRNARRLGLSWSETVHWLLEPRRLVAVRMRGPSGRTVTVASIHCHNSLVWDLIALEVERVVPKVLERLPADEPVMLAGDLNAAGREHPAIRALERMGLREDTTDSLVLDHVFHRNLETVAPPLPVPTRVRELTVPWKGSPRRVTLSDHDIVEAVYRVSPENG